MYAGSPKHPIFSGSTFGLMSGEKPLFKPQVEGGHEALGNVLNQMGLHYEETSGKYKDPERSYIIHNPTVEQMNQLGKMFGQESYVHSQNGQHKLIYVNGEHEGKYNPAQHQLPVEHFERPPEDFYTAVPGHGYMRINFDFNQTHPLEHSHQKSEREFTVEEATYLAKNAVAQLLRDHAPKMPHPHAYDWHDGHTDHHEKQDLAGPQLPGLRKAGEQPQSHPHMDTPPKAPGADHPTNEQAAGVGVSTYRKFALPYGDVKPGASSNLLHYKYHGKLPEIEKLVADHGYKTYYAGGKYGKPDLANKNYNTGHLMIYDPTPESGGDFGHEEYTRGWRQIHELAHALTYPELNKIYGEGRRMGKLGTHRTLNEALRAVHWEWLAAHKQRELSKQVGVHVSDEDFNKELNTVMHDAAHRAVTGKFTEPSGEGFIPHGHKVPLHTALQMVRDSAHQMGLQGMHDTLKKPMAKSEPENLEKTLKVRHVPPSHPRYKEMMELHRIHNEIQQQMKNPNLPGHKRGEMGQQIGVIRNLMNSIWDPHHQDTMPDQTISGGGRTLKRPPQAQVERKPQLPRKPIDPSAVEGQNPYTFKNPGATYQKDWLPKKQGPAGYVPDVKWKKDEASMTKSEPNLTSAEGESPVADEKTYTVEEANAILLKATREKVKAFEEKIQALHGRELKKAIIPPHRHNESVQAGPAAEDVPPSKVNPPGVDKSMKKDAMASTAAAPGSAVSAAPGSSMAMSELCKTCKKERSMCKCMGKADLWSENGKRTDNHTVSGSKEAPKTTPEVNAGTKKDPASGGVKLPGAHLKRVKNDQPINQKVEGKTSDLVEKAEPLSKPSVSQKQHNAMEAAAHGHSTLGIPKKVGKEFAEADKGKHFKKEVVVTREQTVYKDEEPMAKEHIGFDKLKNKLAHKPGVSDPGAVAAAIGREKYGAHKMAEAAHAGKPANKVHKNIEGGPKLMAPDLHPGGNPGPTKNTSFAKNAAPPMAKPPSGKNMGTAVPTSAPKAPAMKAEDMDLEKAKLPGQNVTALAGAPARGTGGPDLIPSEEAPKAAPKPQYTPAMHAAAKAGLAAQGITPKLPGAHLKSPKAAGVTRGAMAAPAAAPKPALPAAPKPLAAPGPAKPAGAKPGIFGKLFGKGEEKPEGKKPLPPLPAGDKTHLLFEPEPKVLHPSDKKKGSKK